MRLKFHFSSHFFATKGGAKGAAEGAKKKADLGKDPRKYDKHFKGPAVRACTWIGLPFSLSFLFFLSPFPLLDFLFLLSSLLPS